MTANTDKVRVLRAFGGELLALGRRMHRIARRDLNTDEVIPALRRVVDDLRAALDELATTLGVDN
jgi:hypothetical protein